MSSLSPKHIVVALIAAATLLAAPFALPQGSHLLIDAPQMASQD